MEYSYTIHLESINENILSKSLIFYETNDHILDV